MVNMSTSRACEFAVEDHKDAKFIGWLATKCVQIMFLIRKIGFIRILKPESCQISKGYKKTTKAQKQYYNQHKGQIEIDNPLLTPLPSFIDLAQFCHFLKLLIHLHLVLQACPIQMAMDYVCYGVLFYPVFQFVQIMLMSDDFINYF